MLYKKENQLGIDTLSKIWFPSWTMLEIKDRRQFITIGIILLLLVAAPLTAWVLFKPVIFKSNAGTPPRPPRPSVNFTSTTAAAQWLTYKSKKFNYTVSYPPEFTVQERGKVGKLDDLVAFTYRDGAKSITVATIQISTQKPPQSLTISSGTDGDGNEVAVYTYRYSATQTLTLLGTINPTVGSSFLFDQALEKMANSLQIK